MYKMSLQYPVVSEIKKKKREHNNGVCPTYRNFTKTFSNAIE